MENLALKAYNEMVQYLTTKFKEFREQGFSYEGAWGMARHSFFIEHPDRENDLPSR